MTLPSAGFIMNNRDLKNDGVVEIRKCKSSIQHVMEIVNLFKRGED